MSGKVARERDCELSYLDASDLKGLNPECLVSQVARHDIAKSREWKEEVSIDWRVDKRSQDLFG